MPKWRKVIIDGEEFIMQKVRYPFCTGCYFQGKQCPKVPCTNGTKTRLHEYIFTKNYEKVIYHFGSSLLRM
jgi:hypothetical protein